MKARCRTDKGRIRRRPPAVYFQFAAGNRLEISRVISFFKQQMHQPRRDDGFADFRIRADNIETFGHNPPSPVRVDLSKDGPSRNESSAPENQTNMLIYFTLINGLFYFRQKCDRPMSLSGLISPRKV